MSIIILQSSERLTKEKLQKALEEHGPYIKFTIDLYSKTVALGGEFHADAEKILLEKYNCKSINIVGGGYNIAKDLILTNAMLNIRPNLGNASPEILDPQKRLQFLEISEKIVEVIKSLS